MRRAREKNGSSASEEWLEEEVLNGRRHKEGSLIVWDSTRGILGERVFPWAVGPGSRDDPRDDVFPRRVRIVVQVARGWSPEARLRRPLARNDEVMALTSTRAFRSSDEDFVRYVKVGDEWLRLGSLTTSEAAVQRRRRGSHSARDPLPVGTPVFAGMTFRMTVDVPVRRAHAPGAGR